jgi:Transglutaminase-like superfamily
LISRLRALRRLRGSELPVFVRVLTLSPLCPLLLHLPLPVVSWAVTRRRGRRGRGLEPQRAAAVVETAQAFAHPLVRRGCLTRGLSLFWLLNDPADDMRICFGLGGPADGFAGHCWLERGGEPYLERVDPRERFPEQFAIPAR